MHSSFALMLTTSLPFAGSAAAKDLWPKTAPSPAASGEEWAASTGPEPSSEFVLLTPFMPDAVAA